MSDDDRRTRKLTRQIESFAGRHGGARGQVAYLGEPGARLVLVGADGSWGDLVAPSMQSATAAAEAAGVALQEDFDGEMAAEVRTGPYEWTRMAGIQVGGPANPGAAAEPPEPAAASEGGAERSEAPAAEPAADSGESAGAGGSAESSPPPPPAEPPAAAAAPAEKAGTDGARSAETPEGTGDGGTGSGDAPAAEGRTDAAADTGGAGGEKKDS
ncbi:hypothetical protein [Streptomyces aculeolatus]|uniref:hypothetical protein n=1 Tax=Streptomyces aculeolatus TaxID=270689 RepID=UPI001CEC2B2E|nr:hypothetical protein [Streptomyces aculeolatus]